MISVTAGRYFILSAALIILIAGCSGGKPGIPKKPKNSAPDAIPRLIIQALSNSQRVELGFPPEIIAEVEAAAGAQAEPFFETVTIPSENLRGEKGIESDRLAGFSVHTRQADEVIAAFLRPLRRQGYLIFRSRQNYGNVPDMVTVVKGNNSYDILKMQKTEAPSYNLDTKAIIAWLKARQHDGSFIITGGGQDRVEAQFIRPPTDMRAFARKVVTFAPDVLREGPRTIDKLAEDMKKTNGFYLVWD